MKQSRIISEMSYGKKSNGKKVKVNWIKLTGLLIGLLGGGILMLIFISKLLHT